LRISLGYEDAAHTVNRFPNWSRRHGRDYRVAP
jgi:hypothetical protein